MKRSGNEGKRTSKISNEGKRDKIWSPGNEATLNIFSYLLSRYIQHLQRRDRSDDAASRRYRSDFSARVYTTRRTTLAIESFVYTPFACLRRTFLLAYVQLRKKKES